MEPLYVKNEKFVVNNTFKGFYGGEYPTLAAANEANRSFSGFFYIVHDVNGKRLEFTSGIGEVEIFVGYKKQWDYDVDGVARMTDVPVYRTETF